MTPHREPIVLSAQSVRGVFPAALAALALCAGSPSVVAQALLRAPLVPGAQGVAFGLGGLASADIDADGHPDVVAITSTEARWVAGTPDGPFGANAPFLGGGPLRACALADIDGDGLPDAITSAPGASGIAVRRNLGGGVFGAPLVLPTSTDVTSLLVADVSGDGAPDVVAGLLGQYRITIRLGDGSGAFPTTIDAVGPHEAYQISAGDLDGDGDADLALLADPPTFGPLDAWVMAGHGDGHFDAPQLLSTVGRGLAVADFTADGVDDIAITTNASPTGPLVLYVHAGGAGLLLPVAQTLPVLYAASRLVAGDLDADGRPDLVQVVGPLISTHLQGPAGGLGAGIGGATGRGAHSPLLVDADRDGRLDLLTQHPDLDGAIGVSFGQGDGGWRTSAVSLPLGNTPFVTMNDAVVADFDGDSRPDLIEAFSGAASAVLRRGGIDGGFHPPQPLALGPDIVRLFADDSTGDGALDLVAVHRGASLAAKGSLQLAVGDGQFGFTLLPATIPTVQIQDAFPADIDRDGLTDVLLSGLTNGGAALQLLRNVGDGSFALVHEVTAAARGAAMGDLDQDGDSDLVVAPGPLAGPMTLLVQLQTAGTFGPSSFYSMPGIEDVQLVDLDADGLLDLVAAAIVFGTAGNVLVRRGLGAGAFGELETYPVPADGASLLAVAELDGDAAPELVVGLGTSTDRDVHVFDVVAGVPVWLEMHRFGSGAWRLVVADGNFDGHSDLFVVGSSWPVLQELRSTQSPWTRLGAPLAGSAGDSLLAGQGPLLPGSPVRIDVLGAVPLSSAVLLVGFAEANLPFKGGVLVPTPDVVIAGLPLDAAGDLELLTAWPGSVPPGLLFVMQLWQADAGGPQGFSATNGLRANTP